MSFPVAVKQMRQLSGLCGWPARRGVLFATDWDTDSDEEDLSFNAWAAFQKAKIRRKASPRRPNNDSKGANEIKGDGQVLNGFNRRTGYRSRCDTCDSEYHFAPKSSPSE